MRKIYIIFFIGLLIAFTWWGINVFKDTLKNISSSTSYIISDSADTKIAQFKSIPENKELINAMLEINSEFINNPPIKYTEKENNIKNFYKLHDYFPSFSSYYLAKLKIANAIYKELPKLEKNTSSLSDAELKEYFNNNIDDLKKNFGTENENTFITLIKTIRQKEFKKISSVELGNTFFYTNELNLTNFTLTITLSDNSEIQLFAFAYLSDGDKYQKAPLIKLCGMTGGIS